MSCKGDVLRIRGTKSGNWSAIWGDHIKTEVLRLDDITLGYPEHEVLRGIYFTLYAGEIHVIMGVNGVGKSTLLRIITGSLRADHGRMWVCEQKRDYDSRSQAERDGIVLVDLVPEIVGQLSLEENIALRIRGLDRYLLYPRSRIHAQVVRLLEEWELSDELDPYTPGWQISTAHRQMVHILSALANGVRILVLDEPFSSLDLREATHLKHFLQALRNRGISIILVSHSMTNASDLADRITVLREGLCAATFENPGDRHILTQLVRTYMSGTVFASYDSVTNSSSSGNADRSLEKSDDPIAPDRIDGAQPLLMSAHDVSIKGIQQNLSFDVRKGEILGIISIGAWRVSICKALFGLGGLECGRFSIAGHPVSLGEPAQAVRAGLAFIGSGHEEIVPQLSIPHNLTLPYLKKLFPHSVIKRRIERYVTEESESLVPDQLLKRGTALSSGEKRRICIQRWFTLPLILLMICDPSRELDETGRQALRQAIKKRKAEGTSFLLEFSNIESMVTICDRVLLFNDNKYCGELIAPKITPAAIIAKLL